MKSRSVVLFQELLATRVAHSTTLRRDYHLQFRTNEMRVKQLLYIVLLAARAHALQVALTGGRLMAATRGRVMNAVLVLCKFLNAVRSRRVRLLLVGLRRLLLRRFVVRTWRGRRKLQVRPHRGAAAVSAWVG